MPLKKTKKTKKSAKTAAAPKAAKATKAAKPAKAKRGKGSVATNKKQLPSVKEINDRHAAFKEELGAKIIPNSKIRKYYKSIGVRSEKELGMYLAEEIYRQMRRSVFRAVRNNRKTVRSHDF